MTSLQDLGSGNINNKGYLNIVCNDIKAKTFEAETVTIDDLVVEDLTANLLTLNNQVSVPNAPLLSTSFWSSGSGNLSQTDDVGATVTYATTAFVGDYLPRDGSLPMTGNLNMNSNALQNVSNITTATSSVLMGNGSLGNTNTVSIGLNSASNGLNSVAIGNGSLANSRCVAVGPGAFANGTDSCSFGRSAQGAGSNQTICGANSSCNASQYACAFGQAVHSNAFAAITIGAGNNNTTNSQAQSVLFGDSQLVNLRPDNDAFCDLGTANNRFKDLHLSGSISGSSQQENEALVSQVGDVLAPRGQRDSWQYPATAANGSGLIYAQPLDIILSYGNMTGADAIRYSNDGGINYTNVSYDTAGPVGFAIVGYSPSLALVVAIGSGSNESYTSVDGINFIQGPNLPSITAESFNIEWFESAGLFVTGVQDVGQNIMTSPDGLTWSLQTSSIQALTLKSNSDIIVAVGSVAPYIQYSTDGINWTNTASIVDYCRALNWSQDKEEFLALAFNTGEGFRSSDGINWSSVGVIAPIQVNNTLEYLSQFERYYLAKVDTVGNYSLWSSLNSSSVFVGTHLDGADPNPLTYSLLYLPLYDRFVMGTNNQKAAYSTKREDIKALSDNIRVRNMPVHVDCYSTYDDISVNNTVVETVLSTASSIGTTTFQRNLELGSVINLNICLVASSVAGDTLTLRVKAGTAGTGLLYSHVLTIPALSVNLPIQIRDKLSIRNGVIQMNGVEELNGFVNNVQASAIIFDRTVQNIFNVSSQWGANVNQVTFNAITYDCMFRNGA